MKKKNKKVKIPTFCFLDLVLRELKGGVKNG